MLQLTLSKAGEARQLAKKARQMQATFIVLSSKKTTQLTLIHPFHTGFIVF